MEIDSFQCCPVKGQGTVTAIGIYQLQELFPELLSIRKSNIAIIDFIFIQLLLPCFLYMSF